MGPRCRRRVASAQSSLVTVARSDELVLVRFPSEIHAPTAGLPAGRPDSPTDCGRSLFAAIRTCAELALARAFAALPKVALRAPRPEPLGPGRAAAKGLERNQTRPVYHSPRVGQPLLPLA